MKHWEDVYINIKPVPGSSQSVVYKTRVVILVIMSGRLCTVDARKVQLNCVQSP